MRLFQFPLLILLILVTLPSRLSPQSDVVGWSSSDRVVILMAPDDAKELALASDWLALAQSHYREVTTRLKASYGEKEEYVDCNHTRVSQVTLYLPYAVRVTTLHDTECSEDHE